MHPADITRLLTLAALWGGSFLLYRIVAPVLGALGTAEVRVAVAGIALLGWHALAGPPFAWRTHVKAMTVVGVFNSAIPFVLFGFAAQTLPAAYLAILNATSPLFGALVARVWLGEALTLRRSAGVAAGLAGVAALVGLGPVAVGPATLAACAACLVGAASYGFAGNYTRRLRRPVAPASMATGSQLAAALFIAPLLPFAPVTRVPDTTVIVAALVLAIACTSVAYRLYFRLIDDIGATRALTVTFLIPLFAIVWGWLVLDEVPTLRMAVGGVMVVVATWLITMPPKPPTGAAERAA